MLASCCLCCRCGCCCLVRSNLPGNEFLSRIPNNRFSSSTSWQVATSYVTQVNPSQVRPSLCVCEPECDEHGRLAQPIDDGRTAKATQTTLRVRFKTTTTTTSHLLLANL